MQRTSFAVRHMLPLMLLFPPAALPQAAAPPAARALRLEELEQMALRRHPVLAQAVAAVRASEAARQQSGLYANPVIGYTGDEINRGRVFNYGEHGVFAEQRLITGGKLGIARQLAAQDVAITKADAELERLRITASVRRLFYQALAEQRLLDVRTQLAQVARRAVQTTGELANLGQADRPDLLAVDIEAQRVELGLVQTRNALQRTWRQLGAATGNPQLEATPLDGNLEDIPNLDFDTELARVFEQSPEIRMAQAGTERGELAVRQARATVIPDVTARAGMHYNRERLELGGRSVGWQASVELGVELPIFNRNQGNVAAARAQAERATLAVERTRLELRSRLASSFREYQDAIAVAERYRTQMIPSAQKAYDLYLSNFRQMAAPYPQVILTQRNLFQLQEDYVAALMSAWQRVVDIQALLVTSGAESTGHN